MSKKRIIQIKNDKIISEDSDVAQSLNSFFTSIVTKLKIPEYTDKYPNSENITDPIRKITLKYRNHLSITTIGVYPKKELNVLFPFRKYAKKK